MAILFPSVYDMLPRQQKGQKTFSTYPCRLTHPWAITCYDQPIYQIWSLCFHPLHRYERRYKILTKRTKKTERKWEMVAKTRKINSSQPEKLSIDRWIDRLISFTDSSFGLTQIHFPVQRTVRKVDTKWNHCMSDWTSTSHIQQSLLVFTTISQTRGFPSVFFAHLVRKWPVWKSGKGLNKVHRQHGACEKPGWRSWVYGDITGSSG